MTRPDPRPRGPERPRTTKFQRDAVRGLLVTALLRYEEYLAGFDAEKRGRMNAPLPEFVAETRKLLASGGLIVLEGNPNL